MVQRLTELYNKQKKTRYCATWRCCTFDMETHEELPYSLVIGSLLMVLVMSFVVTRVLTGTCRSNLISNKFCLTELDEKVLK